jgi:hypothetical protein
VARPACPAPDDGDLDAFHRRRNVLDGGTLRTGARDPGGLAGISNGDPSIILSFTPSDGG